MTNSSYNAIVERNSVWKGPFETEPYECGWAKEAIFYIRALNLAAPTGSPGIIKVQISPDGIRWIDEGSAFALPGAEDQISFCRVAHFGNWLRVIGDTNGAELKVLVTLSLKT